MRKIAVAPATMDLDSGATQRSRPLVRPAWSMGPGETMCAKLREPSQFRWASAHARCLGGAGQRTRAMASGIGSTCKAQKPGLCKRTTTRGETRRVLRRGPRAVRKTAQAGAAIGRSRLLASGQCAMQMSQGMSIARADRWRYASTVRLTRKLPTRNGRSATSRSCIKEVRTFLLHMSITK